MPYTRNYTAKIKKCPEWEYLRLTQDRFNEALALMCGKLYDMKNGRLGEDYRSLFRHIAGGPAQYAHGIIMPLTYSKPWGSKYINTPDNKNHEWAVIAARLNSEGNLLFDRDIVFKGFSSEMKIKVFQESAAKIKSVQELTKQWETDKRKWEAERQAWLKQNTEYAANKHRFEAFENEHGKIRGALRWRRSWKPYIDFMAANPDLDPLVPKHLDWNRKFKRFKRRPTYTAPGSRHPVWYQYKKNVSYKDLNLESQTVKLKVLVPDGENGILTEWREFGFFPDPRIKQAVQQGGVIKGLKLIFRDNSPYLAVAIEFDSQPDGRKGPAQAHVDKYGLKWAREKLLEVVPRENLIAVAVDLGIRHIAAATVMKGGALQATQFIKLQFRTHDGKTDNQAATLPHIAAHVRTRSEKLSKTGRIPRNQTFDKELQKHITAMKLDRAKKSAHRIVDLAVAHGAHVLIFEQMQGFIPSDQMNKRINRGLMEWNRRKIVEWAKNIAEPFGILVFEVSPKYTSQVCNKCGMIGYRYSLRDGAPKREKGGRLFACSRCGYRANADFNASVNLHKVFYGEFNRPVKLKGKNAYQMPDGTTVDLDKLEEKELGISADDVFRA